MELFEKSAYTSQMETALYIFPFLITILSLSLLFLDPKKNRSLIIGVLIFVVAMGICISSTFMVNSTFKKQAQDQFQLREMEAWKERQVAKLHELLLQFRDKAEDNRFRMEYLASFGWHIKNESFIRSLQAEKLREEMIAKIPKNHFIAKAVTIKSLPEDIDQELVTQSLESLGFAVVSSTSASDESSSETDTKENPGVDQAVEESDDQAITSVEDNLSDDISLKIRRVNVMYYGPYVKNYEIKLIALTMLRAGVQLKYLRLGEKDRHENFRTVIFDWSEPYTSHPTIKPLDIYNQAAFRR